MLLLWSKCTPSRNPSGRIALDIIHFNISLRKSQKLECRAKHTKPTRICIPIVTTVSATSLHTRIQDHCVYERESKDPNAPWLKHISLPHSQLFDIKKRVQNFSRSVRFFPFISRRDIRTRVWRNMCHTGHYVTNTWYYRVVTNGLSHHPPPRTDSPKNDNFTTITAAALRMLPLSGVVIKYIEHYYTLFIKNWNASNGKKTTLESFRVNLAARNMFGAHRAAAERHRCTKAEIRGAVPPPRLSPRAYKEYSQVIEMSTKSVRLKHEMPLFILLCLACTIPIHFSSFLCHAKQTRCKKWLCGVLLHHLHLLISLALV